MSCRQTLGVGHHREVTPVRRAERRDAVLPARRVLGVHLGRRSGVVREANRREVLCEDLVHHLRLGEVRTAFAWRKRFSGQQEQMLGFGCQNEERGLPHATVEVFAAERQVLAFAGVGDARLPRLISAVVSRCYRLRLRQRVEDHRRQIAAPCRGQVGDRRARWMPPGGTVAESGFVLVEVKRHMLRRSPASGGWAVLCGCWACPGWWRWSGRCCPP